MNRISKHDIILLLVVFLVIVSPVANQASAQANDTSPALSPEIEQLMAEMTPEEKVGQLFLVTFNGTDVSTTSDIARLIRQSRVGGVVISPANQNFVNDETAPQQIASLTNSLQALALTEPLTATLSVTPTTYTPLPLFVALNQEGDGPPYSSLWGGVAPLPSQMAIGATWNPAYSELVGHITGQQLEAVGVNMLLGPSLDVLDRPKPELPGTLGIRSFGGDPYWVGRFGEAYIQGVHDGSGGQVMVVAKHFPGLGGVDRNPDQELPTIQKSLDALRSVELVPFFAVTMLDADNQPYSTTTDALMTSHVRYRGFQGNIRQLTRPISCDAQNLPAILSLPQFSPWRENGGLLVSNSLGVPSIRKFYDPTLQAFPAKRIAQEAFLAGNDLLYIADFGLTDDWQSQMENLESAISFFREKYSTDPTFRERVDQSVARILKKKMEVFGAFDAEHALVSIDQVSEAVSFPGTEVEKIAQDAVTLIYPDPEDLSGRLPSPPLSDENILIVTNGRRGRDCPDCEPYYYIDPQRLAAVMLSLYGPNATGQISAEQVRSMSFARLKSLISTAEEVSPEAVSEPPTQTMEDEALIREADWIIFAILDLDVTNYPDSDALKLFLRERSESLKDKKVVVLAFNAPYFLDTTEVSKLTAYYCLYSKTAPFLDTAVRLLFQEFQPRGVSPVNVDAIGYDIIEVTRPDPNQVINLEVFAGEQPDPLSLTPTATPPLSPEGTPIPIQLNLEVGDELTLRTGKILDHNGNPVPDGTPVEFRLVDTVQGLEARLPSADTVDGIATTKFNLDRSGNWQITASSDTATRSVGVIVTIPEEGLVEVGFDRPTSTSTATSTATPSPSPTPEPTSTPTPTVTPKPATPTATRTPTATPEPAPVSPGKTVNAFGLFLSILGLVVFGCVTYVVAAGRNVSHTVAIQRALISMISGLGGYVLFAVGLFPLERLTSVSRAVQDGFPHQILPVVVTLVFSGLGLWLTTANGWRKWLGR